MAAATGNLTPGLLTWNPESATCIVLATSGYPGSYTMGKPITGIENVRNAEVFHAGTRRAGDELMTAGGRVLGVTATGSDLKASIDNAYAAVRQIHFDGMHYRTDIGLRGLRNYYNGNGAGT
jgi:phosphoribosylamine--glycine ligase